MALGLFLLATAAAVAGVLAIVRGALVQGALLFGLGVLLGPIGVSVLV
jgi:hypothetical protein